MNVVQGDFLGLQLPPAARELHEAGTEFLTQAFHASGALDANNRVARITEFAECPGGSTGRKLLLSVAYEKPEPSLHSQLFVKFSRDFDDPIRDRAKNQIEAEVRLALLSRRPGFPIAVPVCYFADYHRESGTGLLITQRVGFGTNGIEPAYEKCRDDAMPDMLAHYRALLTTLARLAAAHKSGRLAEHVTHEFPFDVEQAIAADSIRYSEQQLLNRVSRYEDFAARYPQLLPSHVRSASFIEKLRDEVPLFLRHERAIKRYLVSNPAFIALCHWNANVDNAWFWRNRAGAIECGLMDWGRVGQMNVALALFGSLSAAELEVWNEHLDELLDLFTTELVRGGGPALDTRELKLQLCLVIALMGLAWLFDAPALIERHCADLAVIDNRLDPRIASNETARVQLHMFTTVLNMWESRDFGSVLQAFLRRTEQP